MEGTYDKQNYTFTTKEGTVYQHIEETEYPNIGYLGKKCVYRNTEEEKTAENRQIENVKKNTLATHLQYKYVRFTSEKEKIYQKSPTDSEPWIVMTDIYSKKYAETIEKLREEEESNNHSKERLTPKDIAEKVKTTIKGQDEAIETIATCLWATLKNRKLTKKQMLLIGPTGVGKTAIFEKLQKILNIPVVIFSVPGLSQTGYVGRSTDEILKQIYYACDEDITTAENSIVVLDEIDKIAFNRALTSADISTIGVQNELLKMIEGCERVIDLNDGMDSFTIDTSNVIFVASGAFQELYEKKMPTIGFSKEENDIAQERQHIKTEDLVKYGMKRELLGRLPIIVELNALTKEILKEIILESDQSEWLAHIDFLESLGVCVQNAENIVDLITEDAIKKGIGARGLVETINKIFLRIIYEVANNPNKYNEVIIGKKILTNPFDFELVEKRTKKRTRFQKNNQG